MSRRPLKSPAASSDASKSGSPSTSDSHYWKAGSDEQGSGVTALLCVQGAEQSDGSGDVVDGLTGVRDPAVTQFGDASQVALVERSGEQHGNPSPLRGLRIAPEVGEVRGGGGELRRIVTPIVRGTHRCRRRGVVLAW